MASLLSKWITYLLFLTVMWFLAAVSVDFVSDAPVSISDSEAVLAPSSGSLQTSSPASSASFDYPRWSWFGQVPAQDKAETVDTVETKATDSAQAYQETGLALTLSGVIDHPDRGVAFIVHQGRLQVYAPGEVITSGARLDSVHGHFVLIAHQGRLERLTLAGFEDARSSARASAGKDADKDDSSAVMPDAPTQSQQAQLHQISETLRTQPMKLAQFLRFKPINDQGTWIGVKIWPKSDPALFRAVGFAPGDLVKSINGQSIDAMAQNPALWQKQLRETQFDMEIERDGLLQVITVDLSAPEQTATPAS